MIYLNIGSNLKSVYETEKRTLIWLLIWLKMKKQNYKNAKFYETHHIQISMIRNF